MILPREHIIEEIKRTAKENGGTPLGVRRFEAETGITSYGWGRYWSRWAEAQQAAGFVPNDFITAFSEETLIEHLIVLIRELNKFPTPAELRLKSRNAPEFPNDKVFDRLGNKQQKLRKILAYCKSKAGYEDIIPLCSVHVIVEEAAQDEKITQMESGRVGYVYLLKFRRNDYKIGASSDPERRFGEISTKMPEPPMQIHAIKTDDPFGVEAYWHRRFASKQLDKNSEWFQLTAADVQAFCRWKRIF